jgi:hypothetical protein
MGKWLDFLKREHSDTHLALFLAFGGFYCSIISGFSWRSILLILGSFRWQCSEFMLFGFLFALAALSAFLSGRGP